MMRLARLGIVWVLGGWILPVAAAQLEPAQGELPRLPPREPSVALEGFEISPGFQVELVANEPLVADPVAVAFDEQGHLYVVEMRGYSEHREDRLGRIRWLEDLDGDGRMDRSTLFAEDLAWPTAVACWNGGIFVAVTPDILYLKDHDGDRVADERRTVFSGFGHGVARLNVQALPNSFTWGLDNRIHGATSRNGGLLVPAGGGEAVQLRGRDFSFDPATLELRAETGGGQHGMTFDDVGRKFVCSNSRHARQVIYDVRRADRSGGAGLPPPVVDIAVDGAAAEVFRISPDEPWRIVRTRWRVAGLVGGPVEGGGRVSGYFTAATGIMVYRGDAWPASHQGDLFVADAGSNLIHRKKLRGQGLPFEAVRPASETDREFMASQDNWFRPVQLANGPDGCLYVIDMYREVIEHPWSLPQPIKSRLDLNRGRDRGRIYRIVPQAFERRPPPRLRDRETSALVELLQHNNGWHRDTAARLLYERQDPAAVPALKQALRTGERAVGRLHALYVLDGIKALHKADLLVALRDPDAAVRRHALRLCETRLNDPSGTLEDAMARLAGDPDPEVRLQLAFTLETWSGPGRGEVLETLARSDVSNPWIRGALLGAVRGGGLELFKALAQDPSYARSEEGRAFLAGLARLIGARGSASDGGKALAELLKTRENLSVAAQWLKAFREGVEGSGERWGREGIVPMLGSLFQRAERVARDPAAPLSERLAAIELMGQGPWDPWGKVLTEQLRAGESAAVQQAALRGLRAQGHSKGGRAILQGWPQLGRDLQQEALPVLLSRRAWTRELLDAVRDGRVSADALSPAQVARLRGMDEPDIREAVAVLWPESPRAADPVEAFQESLELRGDPRRGQTVYRERCATCHRAGREGHELGPDLETVRRTSPQELLVHILDPNREVAPPYVQYDIETRDGEQLSGIIVRESTREVHLRQAGGVETVLPRRNIRRMQSGGHSVMPEGLAEGLGSKGMADLLAFLTRGVE